MERKIKMEADFSGYATKAGLKCSDGRTIMPDAFKHQDNMQVPLVWQHGHNDPENVLGHAVLENRADGVYAYGFFNDTAKAKHAKSLVSHKDITMLSIWANDLIERGGKVLHGAIREVSLVLSGANPGARIESVSIRHSDGDTIELEDEAIIYTGVELEHSSNADDTEDNADASGEETIQDIYDSMTEKQKAVLHFMLGEAIQAAQDNAASLQQDNVNSDNAITHQSTSTTNDQTQEGTTMTRNVFENTKDKEKVSLSHSDIKSIVADATKTGSLKEAVGNYALAHGITNIDILFPDATALNNVPEFLARRNEWVSNLLGAARKSPFSRIKTLHADITMDEARAKGYVTGAMKKEEFFSVSKRVTQPTTIYKKQKLDRDDMIDITDFDVVAWLKAEMRLMLDEEIARAILIGDGRDISHEDKINEGNIRPIASDHELYTTTINVNIDDSNSSVQEIIDAIVLNRKYFKGSGLPTMYTTETYIAKFLLLKDTLGRRIYKTLDELATELRVKEIVPVEVMEEQPDLVAVIVNPMDYVIGATGGGQVSMFDDFDIDYNQYKYLIETRMCGALTKMKSALVVKKVAGTLVLVVPTAPTFDPETGELTITDTTGVVYKDGSGTTLNNAGSPYTVPSGSSITVNATPAVGYYFSTSEGDSWTFTAD